MLQSQISEGTVSLKICYVTKVFPAFSCRDVMFLTFHQLRPTSDRTKVRTLVRTSDMRSCMKKRTRNGSNTGRLSWKQHGGYIFQILQCYRSSSFVMESMESIRLN